MDCNREKNLILEERVYKCGLPTTEVKAHPTTTTVRICKNKTSLRSINQIKWVPANAEMLGGGRGRREGSPAMD